MRAEVLLTLAALPVQDVGDYLQAMAATITRVLRVAATGLLIHDADADALVSLTPTAREQHAEHAPLLECLPLDAPSQLVTVFRHGTPYLAVNVRDDPRLPPVFAEKGIRALLAVPLTVGGERRGVLYVTGRHRGAFSRADEALLTVVATRVGLLLENAELSRRQAELEREKASQQVRQEFLSYMFLI